MRRNDPAQYTELRDEWWEPHGEFAALHWLAAWRAQHLPAAGRDGAVLVDLGCGGGLMGPHVAPLGYRHVGIDIGLPGLALAREHGLSPVGGSALEVPLADSCADVVLACEVLEHVEDDVAVLAECARLLRPGGLLLLDALAATRLSVLINVHLLERLLAAADRLGLDLELVGLRPSIREAIAWKFGRRDLVTMKPVRWTGSVFA